MHGSAKVKYAVQKRISVVQGPANNSPTTRYGKSNKTNLIKKNVYYSQTDIVDKPINQRQICQCKTSSKKWDMKTTRK